MTNRNEASRKLRIQCQEDGGLCTKGDHRMLGPSPFPHCKYTAGLRGPGLWPSFSCQESPFLPSQPTYGLRRFRGSLSSEDRARQEVTVRFKMLATSCRVVLSVSKFSVCARNENFGNLPGFCKLKVTVYLFNFRGPFEAEGDGPRTSDLHSAGSAGSAAPCPSLAPRARGSEVSG